MKEMFRKTSLYLFCALCVLMLSAFAAAAQDESGETDMDVLKEVELIGVSDGKSVKLGEIAPGKPLFLVFSTPT